MAGKILPQAPVCIDPDCPQSVCDECPEHKECCEECVQEEDNCEDCAGHQDCCDVCTDDGCGVLDLVDCNGPHCEYHKDYICDGSCIQLYREQATELIGHGSIPQLPLEPNPSSGFGTWCQNVNATELGSDSGYGVTPPHLLRESSYGDMRQSAGILMQAAAASTTSGFRCGAGQSSLPSPVSSTDMPLQQDLHRIPKNEMNRSGHSATRSPACRSAM